MADQTERQSVAAMTWLEAAEYILKLEGPEMHIRELTRRVLRLNMVNSSCKTSLETLLYRQTQKENSKFQRVAGKLGWFSLKDPEGISSPSHIPLSFSLLSNDEEPVPKSVVVRKHRRREQRSSPIKAAVNETDEEDSGSSDNDEHYRRKYCFLKKMAKTMIYENAALALRLEELQDDIQTTETEKRFLLKKLMSFKNAEPVKATRSPPKRLVTRSLTTQSTISPSSSTSSFKSTSRLLPKAVPPRSKLSTPPKLIHVKPSPSRSNPKAPVQKKVEKPPFDVEAPFMSSSSDSDDEDFTSQKVTTKETSSEVKKAAGKGEAARKKRVRRLQPIPLDNDGNPVLPIQIGGLKVHDLGKIIAHNPAFHNERYIWPVGFKSTRSYPSMTDPSRRCLYTCKILDGGDAPIFEMVSEEDEGGSIRASSATACHHTVLKAINKARDKQASNAGSGPEFFGFSHPTILNIIQNMPGAQLCMKYKRTEFEQPRSIKRAAPAASGTKTKKAALGGGAGKKKAPPAKSRNSDIKKPPATTNTASKAFYLSRDPDSPLGDRSLAPVMYNQQLSGLHIGMDSSSMSSSSDDSDSDSKLVIDAR